MTRAFFEILAFRERALQHRGELQSNVPGGADVVRVTFPIGLGITKTFRLGSSLLLFIEASSLGGVQY
jgi:hypothetical protein